MADKKVIRKAIDAIRGDLRKAGGKKLLPEEKPAADQAAHPAQDHEKQAGVASVGAIRLTGGPTDEEKADEEDGAPPRRRL